MPRRPAASDKDGAAVPALQAKEQMEKVRGASVQQWKDELMIALAEEEARAGDLHGEREVKDCAR